MGHWMSAAAFTIRNTGDQELKKKADQAVAEISVATKAADHALDKLKDIDKAVNIASSVIVLAMAITTKDMGQIANAAKSVIIAAGVSV